MTLEGANVFFDTTDYGIYAMNSATAGQYCVVLPKNSNGTHNMLVDLHMKNAFDSVTSGSKTKEQLIEEIKSEYTGVKNKYTDGILVIPMIDENLYATAVINNDKQKMFDKVKKIGAITSEIYKKLTESGIDKQKIDQKIIMIIKNNDDIKFVDWLKEQMPNFVIGINLSELQSTATGGTNLFDNSNPFMPASPVPPLESNNIFAAQPQEPTPQTNDIFGPSTNSVSEPISQPQPAVAPQPVVEVAQSNVQPQQQVVEPIAPEPAPQPTQVPPVNPTPAVESAPVAPNPIQSTPLEATTTIPVQPTGEVATSGETDTSVSESKGSKGFTNLLILLVILAVVTFVSIELGKFLYNTYGV